jgi:NADH-quinone oxidoreductase subunit M
LAIPILSLMIFLPAVGGLAVYMAGRVATRAAKYLALSITLVEGALAFVAYFTVFTAEGSFGISSFVLQESYPWIGTLITYHVGMDGLSGPLVLMSVLLTALATAGSFFEIKEKESSYYALMMFFLASAVGVFTSLNLILFYFFWEASLIPMFFFIGIWGGPNRKYASVKFLLFTYSGSVAMLLGFLLLYFMTPGQSFDLVSLLNSSIPGWLQAGASALTFLGFGVKLPVFPLHTWLPDAHVEAPSPISVLLAGLLLKMGGYGFLRFNLELFRSAAVQYAWVYIAIGLITMFYGAIVALMQKDFKRMVALTSINHMGFVLLGAFAGLAAGSISFGISGAVFQMFNHAFAIGALFMLAGFIKHGTGTRDLTVLRGLRIATPRMGFILILAALAGMGAPLFSSFISEFMVLLSGITYSPYLWVAVLVPGITAAYLLWMLWRAVLSERVPGSDYHDITRREVLYLALYLVPLVVLLLFPGLLLSPISQFTKAVFGG